jgi:DNA primase
LISDDLIEEIRSRADLVEIVSEHTRLRRSGKTFRGPCPLHGGKGPNFSVDPTRDLFKCFVCGEGGNVYGFAMKQLGMTYPEAIRWVAGRVGIEIPEERRWEEAEEEPFARLYEANAFAAEWFRERLLDPEEGLVARNYLDGRGITPEVRERFGIGWAPESWSSFADSARTHGINRDVLLQLGLLKEGKREGDVPYDAFRGRVIFPILSLSGKVVGFGGRVIGRVDEHVPKYLNSPESPVYRKGEMLYGLRWSKGPIRKEKTALVVEGYMDYVSLAAGGVENIVAPLGTAMTAEQAELIARYAERIILLYDSDQAGLKATFRSGDELLRTGVEVLVATLPEGEDPDSLIRSGGAPALRAHLDNAVDLLDRKIGILEKGRYFSSIAGQRRAVDSLLPTVRATSDEVLRALYIRRIAERTGVAAEVISNEVGAPPAPGSESGPDRAGSDHRGTGEPRRQGGRWRGSAEGGRDQSFSGGQNSGATGARGRPSRGERADAVRLGPERNVVLLLLRDEHFVERAASRLGPDDFRDATWREVYAEILRVHAEGARDDGASSLEALLRALNETDALCAQELLDDPEGENLTHPERFFEENIREIEIRNTGITRLAEFTGEIEKSRGDEAAELLRRKLDLRREMEQKGEVLKMNPTRNSGWERSDG